MYERFFRCAASKTIPGTGLGLSLVHSIIKFYNGRIECDSIVDKGTTFTVTLPIRIGSPSLACAPDVSQAPAEAHPPSLGRQKAFRATRLVLRANEQHAAPLP